MDNSTEVQPAEVEGQGQESSGLYDLSSIPEQLRPAVEPAFKQWEANVTKKFQEHADYRKQWEPFEQLGVNRLQPELMQDLLAFNEMAQSPEQFDAWLKEMAEERGLLSSEQTATEPDPYGYEDAYGRGQDELTPDTIKSLIQEQIQPLYEQAQYQQQQAAVQEATEMIQSELDALHEKHGDFPDEIICQLAMAYDGPQGIQQAFQDYQNIIAQTERSVVESKLSEPSVPERGGSPQTAAPEIKTWDEARDAAIARLRQSVNV